MFFVRILLPVPEVFPFIFLSGFVAAFDFDFFENLLWSFLLLARTPLSYFAIVERTIIINKELRGLFYLIIRLSVCLRNRSCRSLRPCPSVSWACSLLLKGRSVLF